MQDKYSESDYSDNDPTDELPILSEEAILAAGGQIPELDDAVDDDDTAERRVHVADAIADVGVRASSDAAAIGELREELAAIESRLADLADGHAAASLEPEVERRDRELALLGADFEQLRRQLQELRDDVAKASRPEKRADVAAITQPYREEIQSLTAYIAGRWDRWQEMEGLVRSLGERIAELERELEQRVARQNAAEHALQRESERAAELKTQLSGALAGLRAQHADASGGRDARSAVRPDAAPKHSAAVVEELRARIATQDQLIGDLRRRLTERDRADDQQDERLATLQQELANRVAALRQFQSYGGGSSADRPSTQRRNAQTQGPNRPAAATDFPVLVCLTSDTQQRHVISERQMTIGRSTDCAIRIPTHFVSREHARLTRDDDKVTIEDCGSTNGVYVNAVQVERHELAHGDWVTIGETQFRFLSDGAA